jgi:outer membrane protein assembly factor BamB
MSIRFSQFLVRAVSIVAVALVLVVLAVGATPTLTLSTTVGPPTSSVLVSGSSLTPNDTVDIYFDKTNVGSATTDSDGAFSNFAMRVPGTALPGLYSVTAVPRITGGSGGALFRVETDWPQFGFTPQGTRYNSFENVLSPSNVASLGLRWSFNPGNTDFTLEPPALANGVLYFGADGFGSKALLYALNSRTGAQLWSFASANHTLINTPAVENGVAYLVDIGGTAWALDAKTAAVLWSQPYGSTVGASPTLANGRLYYGSEADNGRDFNRALDIHTGLNVWTTSSGTVGSTAAVFNSGVFAGAIGGITAANANTGKVAWSVSLGQGSQTASATVFANGVVYLGAADGSVNALSAKTGATLWKFVAGGGVFGGVAVANGIVYVGSQDKNVYALDAASGAKLWSFAADAPSYYSPAIANGVVYVESIDTTYALDAKTGAKLWSYPIGGNTPIVANGFLYAEDGTGTIYAFGLKK